MSAKYTKLNDYIMDNSMSESEMKAMCRDICRNLKYIEGQDVEYILPEDIYVSDSGEFILNRKSILRRNVPFDISTIDEVTGRFIAPEVMAGALPDASALIYSLGQIMNGLLSDFYSDEFKNLVYKMTSDDRTLRYSGTDEVIRNLSDNSKLNIMPLTIDNDIEDDEVMDLSRSIEAYLEDNASPGNGCRIDDSLSFSDLIAAEKMQNDTMSTVELSDEIDSMISQQRSASHHDNSHSSDVKRKKVKKKKKSKTKIILGVLLGIAIIAAGIHIAIPKNVTDIVGVEDVEMYYDETTELNCSIEPSFFKNAEITYVSDDTYVFEVSSNGIITAHKPGTANITVSAKGYSESAVVTVKAKVTGITGIEKSYEMVEGDETQLNVVIKPAEFKDEKIEYSSSDDSVASISKSGKIKALKAGKADITITAGGYEKTVTVTVNEPAPVAAVQPSTTVNRPSTGNDRKPAKKPSNSDGDFSGDELF